MEIMITGIQDMRDSITEKINSMVVEHEAGNKNLKIWKEPIVGFVSAENENLPKLKETVCAEHYMPKDILADAKGIIVYFIPFQDNIAKSNIEGQMASTEWAIAYIKTNNLIRLINEELEVLVRKDGYRAGKISAVHSFDTKKLVSTWSHRHIAYIAGMGTFGINNMLITKNGCCGRFGSIIVNCELGERTQAGEIKEKCLNKLNGTCGICQSNCVAKCFGRNYFDRQKCYDQCLKNKDLHKKFGHADVCGKCEVNLPCSTSEPAAPVAC